MINSKEKQKEGSTEEKELEVIINNGDFKLIDSLVESYGFKDRDSLFKFAIGTLVDGNNNEGIYTIKLQNGQRVLSKIAPSKDLLNDKPDEGQ